MWWGCDYDQVRVADVVDLGDGIHIGRGKSLRERQSEHGASWRSAYDIAGGAIPSELRDGVLNTELPGEPAHSTPGCTSSIPSSSPAPMVGVKEVALHVLSSAREA